MRQFNVESEEELLVLSGIAHDMNRVAPISIRVNPDVDAKTHEKIATGKARTNLEYQYQGQEKFMQELLHYPVYRLWE